MINTYHTNYNPPPVPPRPGYSRPPLPANTALVKLLSVILVLLTLLTLGGFFLLFQKLNRIHLENPEESRVSKFTGGLKRPIAHMLLQRAKPNEAESRMLFWDSEHSLLQDVGHRQNTLIILQDGLYFLYSHITFSRNHEMGLKQAIYISGPSQQDKDREILKSFCSLNTAGLCTASMSGVFQLKKDQKVYVNVTNTSLINRDSSHFGLFKLY